MSDELFILDQRDYEEGQEFLIFDSAAWQEGGGDKGDNSCYYVPCTITKVYAEDEYGVIVTVKTQDGRTIHGCFAAALRRPE